MPRWPPPHRRSPVEVWLRQLDLVEDGVEDRVVVGDVVVQRHGLDAEPLRDLAHADRRDAPLVGDGYRRLDHPLPAERWAGRRCSGHRALLSAVPVSDIEDGKRNAQSRVRRISTDCGHVPFIGVILLPLFLVLGQEFAQASASDAAYFGVLGELLRTGRDLVNHVALIIALSMGDLLLFYILCQSRFVPRWLSAWGIIGAVSTMLASFLVLFRLAAVVTPLYLVMNAPLALQSLVMAMWLITRGFDTSSLESELAKRTFS